MLHANFPLNSIVVCQLPDCLYTCFAVDHEAVIAKAREGFVEKALMDKDLARMSKACEEIAQECKAENMAAAS
jgi:hypothetical protein